MVGTWLLFGALSSEPAPGPGEKNYGFCFKSFEKVPIWSAGARERPGDQKVTIFTENPFGKYRFAAPELPGTAPGEKKTIF